MKNLSQTGFHNACLFVFFFKATTHKTVQFFKGVQGLSAPMTKKYTKLITVSYFCKMTLQKKNQSVDREEEADRAVQ